MKHGLYDTVWNAAKLEMRVALVNRARRRSHITLAELVACVKSIKLDPHDGRISHMLHEIGKEDDKDHMGILSVLVVQHHHSRYPIPVFYKTAKELGRNVDKNHRLNLWVREMNKVFQTWKKEV